MRKVFSFLVYLLPILPLALFPLLNSLFFHLDYREILGLFCFYLFIFFLGLVVFPFMSLLFPRHPDGAYGASRILGLVLFSYILWSFSAFFDVPLVHWNIWGVLIFLSFLFIVTIFVRDDALLFVKHKSDLIIVETLFSFLFFAFLIQYSYHPEAYGGEKSMDFSLLSYFTRLEYLPPHDPWAQGSILRYYYWGYFIFAQLLKGAGLVPHVGYLVAMASLPALMAGGCYSLILSVVRRRALAFWGALTIVLACNYQSLINFFTKANLDFSYFWSATRVFKTDLFAEFPSWSFSFLDLHPHVMAYPFVILALIFVWRLFEAHGKANFLFCLLGGLSLGLLVVTNLWDYLMLGLLLAIVTLFHFRRLIIPVIGTVFISLLLYLPITIRMLAGREGGSSLSLERMNFNGPIQFLAHQGQWWFFLVWTLLFALGFYLVKRHKPRMEFGLKSFLLMFALSLTLVLFSNYFILIDKINTLFKLNTAVWVFMGLGSFFLLRRFVYFRKNWSFLFYLPLVVFSLVLIWGTVANVKALASFKGALWPRPTLDVSAFVNAETPELGQAIAKLNEEVQGDKNFLEPYGKTYDFESNKLSVFTGLSSYLVWPGQHVNQRGLSWADIELRKKEVDSFYQNKLAEDSCVFLKKKKIHYLFWTEGELELKCVEPWFKSTELRIYKRLEY